MSLWGIGLSDCRVRTIGVGSDTGIGPAASAETIGAALEITLTSSAFSVVVIIRDGMVPLLEDGGDGLNRLVGEKDIVRAPPQVTGILTAGPAESIAAALVKLPLLPVIFRRSRALLQDGRIGTVGVGSGAGIALAAADEAVGARLEVAFIDRVAFRIIALLLGSFAAQPPVYRSRTDGRKGIVGKRLIIRAPLDRRRTRIRGATSAEPRSATDLEISRARWAGSGVSPLGVCRRRRRRGRTLGGDMARVERGFGTQNVGEGIIIVAPALIAGVLDTVADKAVPARFGAFVQRRVGDDLRVARLRSGRGRRRRVRRGDEMVRVERRFRTHLVGARVVVVAPCLVAGVFGTVADKAVGVGTLVQSRVRDNGLAGLKVRRQVVIGVGDGPSLGRRESLGNAAVARIGMTGHGHGARGGQEGGHSGDGMHFGRFFFLDIKEEEKNKNSKLS